jgi:hypothetical protein
VLGKTSHETVFLELLNAESASKESPVIINRLKVNEPSTVERNSFEPHDRALLLELSAAIYGYFRQLPLHAYFTMSAGIALSSLPICVKTMAVALGSSASDPDLGVQANDPTSLLAVLCS